MVKDKNLCQDTDYRKVLAVFFSPRRKYQDGALNYTTTASFHIQFNSRFSNSEQLPEDGQVTPKHVAIHVILMLL
jgi:hypothetical protein